MPSKDPLTFHNGRSIIFAALKEPSAAAIGLTGRFIACSADFVFSTRA
jgi:hypothetical protein